MKQISVFIMSVVGAICMAQSAHALGNIDKLADEGRFSELVKVCDKAIQADPKDAKAYGNRGWAKYHLGSYKPAIDDCDKAIRLDPTYARAYRYRGDAYMNLGLEGAALADCSKAIELSPQSDPWSHSLKGRLLGSQGDYKGAIDELNKAIAINPNHAGWHYADRAWAHACLREWQDTVNDCNTYLAEDPKCAWAFWQRGKAESHLGKHKDAINDFTTAIRLDPKDARVYCDRGWDYGELGQTKKAFEDYDKALRLDPTLHCALWARAWEYEHAHDYQHAIDDLERYTRLTRAVDFPYLCLAMDYEQIGHTEKALQTYSRWIHDRPSAISYWTRGCTLQKMGRDAEALKDFQTTLQFQPRHPCANWQLARLYEKFGQHKEAVKACTIAISVTPQSFIYEIRARAYANCGQYFLALSDYATAIYLKNPSLWIAAFMSIIMLPIAVALPHFCIPRTVNHHG